MGWNLADFLTIYLFWFWLSGLSAWMSYCFFRLADFFEGFGLSFVLWILGFLFGAWAVFGLVTDSIAVNGIYNGINDACSSYGWITYSKLYFRSGLQFAMAVALYGLWRKCRKPAEGDVILQAIIQSKAMRKTIPNVVSAE